MTQETVRGCAYETARVVVDDWHLLADRYGLDLVEIVGDVLTSATTADLPPGWHGDHGRDRAAQWIATREAESPTLLVIERRSQRGIGLVVLFEVPSAQHPVQVDVRLGYVMAEPAWGRGLASEVVAGLVEWAKSSRCVASLVGGVAVGNVASARVLAKNGFELSRTVDDQHIFELSVR